MDYRSVQKMFQIIKKRNLFELLLSQYEYD